MIRILNKRAILFTEKYCLKYIPYKEVWYNTKMRFTPEKDVSKINRKKTTRNLSNTVNKYMYLLKVKTLYIMLVNVVAHLTKDR